MLNTLSFVEVRKKFRIAIDTDKSATMNVQELEEGLYMFQPESQTSAYLYLNLVSANEGDFSKREVARVKQAQELYRKIGYPGYKNFSNYSRKLLSELSGNYGGRKTSIVYLRCGFSRTER